MGTICCGAATFKSIETEWRWSHRAQRCTRPGKSWRKTIRSFSSTIYTERLKIQSINSFLISTFEDSEAAASRRPRACPCLSNGTDSKGTVCSINSENSTARCTNALLVWKRSCLDGSPKAPQPPHISCPADPVLEQQHQPA